MGEGPVWRLWRRSLPAGGLGVIVGWLVTAGFSSFGSGAHPALLFVVGGMAVCAAYGLGMRRTGPVSVRMTSLMPWLITDTALPAALLCGTLGVALGFVAVPQDTMVSAPALARMLAGGCFTYTLVGFGSFLKVWTEGSRGLVTAPLPPTSWPGPIAVGLFLGIALLLAGRLLVVFSGVEAALVPAIKGAWGLGLGGFLSFLGARQGAVAVGRLAPPAPALG